MDNVGPADLKAQYRQLAIICGVLILAAANYIFIGKLICNSGSEMDSDPVLVGVLAVVALLFLGLAAVVYRIMMQRIPANSTVEARIAKWKIATILSFAVRETTAIFGFVLTMLTGDLRWVVGLAGITVLFMLYAFPRWSTFEKSLKEVPPIG